MNVNCLSTLLFLSAVLFCQAGQAQNDAVGVPGQQQGDLAKMEKAVNKIGEEQQLVIEELKAIKRLLSSNSTVQRTVQPLAPPTTLDIRGEDFKGDRAARVAIIEYSDFECPYCGRYERDTYPQLVESYIKSGKVRLFYRDLPLTMHPQAIPAARAARCAGEQGKYWEMHDSLFARQNALSNPAIVDRAKTLGLDEAKFSECLASRRYIADLEKSVAAAQQIGITGTPTFFIGVIGIDDVFSIKKEFVGAQPYETFRAALDELLDSIRAEGIPSY